MRTTVDCPVCGHSNDPKSSFCTRCRARLDASADTSPGGARLLARLRRAARWRRRLVRRLLLAGAVLALAAWIAQEYVGVVRFLPSPASGLSVEALPGDWPMVQRDTAHTGYVAAGDGAVRGSMRWRFSTAAPFAGSPAVAGGVVYAGTGDGRFLALDANTGALMWSVPVEGPVSSTPAVAGDLVFVGLTDGRVIALQRSTGGLVWELETGGPVFSSPAVRDGVLYVGSSDGRLYVLDALTGRQRWSFARERRITSDPAVNDRVVAITAQDNYVHVIDTNTGMRRLTYRTASTNGSAVLLGDGLYVADHSGIVRRIDWRERELPFEKAIRRVRTQFFLWGMESRLPPQKGLVWLVALPGDGFVGTPAVGNGSLYVGAVSGTLLALDVSSGEERWRYQSGAAVSTSPAIAGDTVLIGDRTGRLSAVDSRTGALRWDFRAEGGIVGSPIFANGMVYFASTDGGLYALR